MHKINNYYSIDKNGQNYMTIYKTN